MELRRELGDLEDLEILYVLPENQLNDKSRRFIDGNGLRDRLTFLIDPGSRAIDRLRIRKPDAEPLEAGVPHPTTYLLDRQGRIRLVDVREDYHVWLDPEAVRAELDRLP